MKYRSIYEKLKELEAQGKAFSENFNAEKSLSLDEITAFKKELMAHFEEHLDFLRQTAEHSRSDHSRWLARTQLDYFQKIKQYFVHFEENEEEEEEGHLLHSEFSIDLAQQSVIYALLTSLHSIEQAERKQMNERN